MPVSPIRFGPPDLGLPDVPAPWCATGHPLFLDYDPVTAWRPEEDAPHGWPSPAPPEPSRHATPAAARGGAPCAAPGAT